ncbi:MAG: motility protein A [Calditrichia bacterium]
MSSTTLLGIFTSVIVLVFATSSQTVTVDTLFNLPGLAIVLGGTAASILFSYSTSDVAGVMRVFYIVIRKQQIRMEQYVQEIGTFALKARKKGLLSLQNEVRNYHDPFFKDGLNMLIDGFTSREVRRIMQQRILNMQLREEEEAQIFRTMGKFAPAFGMLGTVIGLIAMLQRLSGSSIENIGSGMAVALVTTLYGLILANMLFNPIAEKLERQTQERVRLMSMITEGLTMIGDEWHPNKIKEALNAFLPAGKRR